MKYTSKKIWAVVVGLLVASIMAGPLAAQGINRLDTILKRGKIIIGINLTFPPVGFRNASGEADGYDVDLAKDLARTLGVPIEWVPVTNETRGAVLVSDKVDVTFSNYTRTPVRALVLDFTNPYVITGMSILARKSYKIRDLEDLVSKKVPIGVGTGTIGDLLLADKYPNANKVVFDAMSDTLLALKQDKIAAVLEDAIWINAQVREDSELESVGGILNADVNAVALRRGQPDWRRWLNLWLDDLNRTGRNRGYFVKWFKNEPVSLAPNY